MKKKKIFIKILLIVVLAVFLAILAIWTYKGCKIIRQTNNINFYIGGFDSGYTTYNISRDDYVLHYQPSDYWDISYEEQWDKEKFDNLIKDLLKKRVFMWHKYYLNPFILDGTQWKLSFITDNNEISSGGSNAFPHNFIAVKQLFEDTCTIEYIDNDDINDKTETFYYRLSEDDGSTIEYHVNNSNMLLCKIDGYENTYQLTNEEFNYLCGILAANRIYEMGDYRSEETYNSSDWEIVLTGDYGSFTTAGYWVDNWRFEKVRESIDYIFAYYKFSTLPLETHKDLLLYMTYWSGESPNETFVIYFDEFEDSYFIEYSLGNEEQVLTKTTKQDYVELMKLIEEAGVKECVDKITDSEYAYGSYRLSILCGDWWEITFNDENFETPKKIIDVLNAIREKTEAND